MIFIALGRTDAIGASCHYLKLDDTGLVLDAGADPEADGLASTPDFDVLLREPAWHVDHAIITHAHHDHIGALPVLIKNFPRLQVHMTKATRALLDVLLPASARLQRKRLSEGAAAAPLFSEEELDLFSYLYETHELEEDFDVSRQRGKARITARFYNAGHILGSAGVLLSSESGRRVFYSSDTNLPAQSIIPGGDYPEGPVDVLILESTLGADEEAEKTTREAEEERFEEAVRRTVERGGSVLVPVFALGRAQEVLALLHRMKEEGQIPGEVPVFTAGSMRAIADVYDQTRLTTPRLDPDFEVWSVDQRRLPRSGAGAAGATAGALQTPRIFVLTSGMLFEKTPSNGAARALVEDERNAILLVGFAKEDSPAARLVEAAEQGRGTEVVLNAAEGPQPVNCDVERFRFSGHSHRRDLIQLVARLQPKQVVLVHGENQARQWMADNIRLSFPDVKVFTPATGEPLLLFDPAEPRA